MTLVKLFLNEFTITKYDDKYSRLETGINPDFESDVYDSDVK